MIELNWINASSETDTLIDNPMDRSNTMVTRTIDHLFDTSLLTAPQSFYEFNAEIFEDIAGNASINLGNTSNQYFVFSGGKPLVVRGQGGDDTIVLNQGNFDDVVYGGSGNDDIEAGNGDDTLYGGSGNDTLFGSAGADVLYGGSGDDDLNGDNGATPTLFHGQDTLNGGTGNDTLRGGGAADTLTGGDGRDVFTYQVRQDSLVGQADTITDFVRGVDKIDLREIDADGLSSNGDSAFVFVGAPSTLRGTVWTEDSRVYINIDGGAPDMQINVNTTLTSTDFFL